MDTVTHALMGAALSDCWFRRRLGPLATPFALAVGALPDIDVVTYFVAPELAWAYHRGYTHSFFVMLLAAPLLGYAGYRLSRRAGAWWQWALLAVLGLFAHTIVDLVTSWGTMPWLPFSSARVSWDVAPIIDVFVFSVLAVSFAANRLLRWERVDTFLNPLTYPVVHRHPRRRRVGDWFGKVAVALVCAYLLVGWQQNRQTVRVARQELAKAGVEAVEVRALPIMFTYLAWDIVARDASGTIYNAVFSGYQPQPMRFTAFPTQGGPAVERALSAPEGRLFSWYAQGMFVAAEEAVGEGTRVTLSDRRFFILTRPEAARFVMEITIAPDGKVASARARQMGFDGVDLGEEWRSLRELVLRGSVATAGE